jgi:nudix-type nucleoside diphosphatase (YffH/AdpP family)
MTTVVEKVETLYEGFVALRKARLRNARGETFDREVEEHGNGVAVLPYDPDRKLAIVVRLARAPVLLAGEKDFLIEAPAGLLDEGEEPEAAARRETFEETGLELGALTPLGTMWTMPGISTERMTLFLAAYRAGDRTGQGGGLAEEHEDITVTEMPLRTLAALADAGELTDMRMLILLLRLRALHPELF